MSTTPENGASNAFLVGLLAVAACLVGVSLWLLNSDESGSEVPGGDGAVVSVPPIAMSERTRSGRHADSDDEPDPGDDFDDGIEDVPYAGGRSPHGPEFHVTMDDVWAALDVWHWEEVRRRMDVLQQNGETIDPAIVAKLIELLSLKDKRIDAMLALGGVKDAATGSALAQFAATQGADLDARLAALDAIAQGGHDGALAHLQALFAQEDVDPQLLRHGLPALAAVGGGDAARTLTAMLSDERYKKLRGNVLMSLAKTEGAGAVVAQALRAARDQGSGERAHQLLQVALYPGVDADAQLKSEIRQMVENPASLEYVGDQEAQDKLWASARNAAAALGMIDIVLRAAEMRPEYKDSALHGLRNARGDEAAEAIARSYDRFTDSKDRYRILDALGETQSRKATPVLVKALDDEDANNRHAAARALSKARDPNAVGPILKHLGQEGNHYQFDRSLVDALGVIGHKDAVEPLNDLLKRAQEDGSSLASLKNNILRALQRINSGNPNSTRMKNVGGVPANPVNRK